MTQKKRILVTGGAGFIGSNFCNTLSQKYEIVALDNLFLGDPDNLGEGVTFVHGDACKKEDLEATGGNFEYVLHFAGTSSAPMFMEDGFADGYVNSVESFVRTLEYARKQGAKRFLYASTSSLYGNNPMPLVETQNVTPLNHYAVTKFCYEHCSACYNQVYPEMDIIGFRFMSIYGPNEEAKGEYANIISQFIWDAVRDKTPVIYGDGNQFRDFTNVADVVQALTLAMEHDQKLGADVFNIGTGECCSFNEILEAIGDAFGRKIEPKYIPNPVKEGYVKGQHADISKIQKVLGFEPKVKLADGIREQVANVRPDKIRQTSSDFL